MSFWGRIFGDQNEKELKKLAPLVAKINELEPGISALADDALKAKTAEFRRAFADGASLDDLLPEAFAVVREAAKRVLGERPYDVQLVGGIALHQGKIAEMKTGEGKTLASTLPIYLNALAGRGVHVVTVNEYLARRDAEWMGKVYNFLGLAVGLTTSNQPYEVKRNAYAADITYGTNNEFGFDYLRDNMAAKKEHIVQREAYFAIVDEVDSILIDEARTPLIISAPDEESTDKYYRFAEIAKTLTAEEDYNIDEKLKAATLTEAGIAKIEKALGVDNIYESGDIQTAHHIEQALKAQTLMHRDQNYVIKDGQVIIVDEFTGRLMAGRRYSEGLHQAIEAKEGVEIKRETRTMATITFQNYFRLYEKLGGMTGTAKTEEEEFYKIYGLEVLVVPTNKPIVRDDKNDLIYQTEMAKYQATARDIKERHEKGQPVLVGTISVEKSELLSDILKREGVPHEVLNAKHHEREAEIVAGAGQKDAVTIATNMAGRGTDIKLGEGVREVGGLHVIGTERHESRRIDNQLRGRCGRQGDPGSSQFYVSMGDDLMRIFGSERMASIMKNLNIPEDQPLEHKMISRGLEQAQKKVEGHNFDIRKHVVEYDDVLNRQREKIYGIRRNILNQGDVSDEITRALDEEVLAIVGAHAVGNPEGWSRGEIFEHFKGVVEADDEFKKEIEEADTPDRLTDILKEKISQERAQRLEQYGEERIRQAERIVLLRAIDVLWMDHLDAMHRLRESIGLQGYAQKNPLIEYKQQGHMMFEKLQRTISSDVAHMIFKIEPPEVASSTEKKEATLSGPKEPDGDFDETDDVVKEKVEIETTEAPTEEEAESEPKPEPVPEAETQALVVDEVDERLAPIEPKPAPIPKGEPAKSSADNQAGREVFSNIGQEKVGRNDPCPCGSGKKYKKCHGR